VLKDDNMESWYTLVSTCQRQGVDVMSAARMIAWAMELFEKGIIDETHTQGIQLLWGNTEAISEIIGLIAENKGFGAVLACNVFDAAARIGKDVEEALNIKGVPLGGTNVMNFRARTIGAIINPRGGDEYRGRMGSFDNMGSGKNTGMTGMAVPDSWESTTALDIIKKAKLASGQASAMDQHDPTARGAVAALANRYSIVSDSLGQCKWNTLFLNVGVSIEFQAKALSAGLGKQIDIDDLLEIASRISAQERLFSIRGGFTRDHDTLPKRLINYQMPGSWPQDKVMAEELEMMKEEFYESMGWDKETGVPRDETLKALDLLDLENELKKTAV
jgi:aldehyde:ferredoxin oxidoreductase